MFAKKVPLYFKVLLTAFMALFIPTYWINYGPTNFLWFSDTILFLFFFAAIFESRCLISMGAIAGLLLEAWWTVDFFFLLFFDIHLTTLTDYMFSDSLALYLRVISLFHLALLPMIIWLLVKLGYDRRAWAYQTLFSWTLVFATWLFTNPAKNINWVHGYKKIGWPGNEPSYLIFECLVLTFVFGATHLLIRGIYSKSFQSSLSRLSRLARWPKPDQS